MIENEAQYRVTVAMVGKFHRALEELAARSADDPLMRKLEEDALGSKLEELESELRVYESRAAEGF